MNRYRVTVSVKKTYIAVKEATFDVEAENENAAMDSAYDDAEKHVYFRSLDPEEDETEIEVTSAEFISGENPPDGTIPLCDKTIDMFGEEE